MMTSSRTSLTTLAEEQLAAARAASSGRSAVTVHGGQEHRLRQTLMALAEGHQQHEHEPRGEATVQVLHGRIRLIADGESWEANAGDLLVAPVQRHRIEALTDSVFLFTTVVTLS